MLLKPPFNSLPNDKILDYSKLKEFADGKIKVSEKLKLVLGWVENIFGKRENAGYQHFLLFPKCFQKPPSSRSLKVGIVWSTVKWHETSNISFFFFKQCLIPPHRHVSPFEWTFIDVHVRLQVYNLAVWKGAHLNK